ncbi:MAG TPA: PilZ domain-containing protein [Terriglobales bacterium]|jgi:CheY-like chemotaxis protein|nr:PilZ domain-containing protein [Terriglobales bacterium]
MSLRALLVSRDADALDVLQGVMRDLDVESEVCADIGPAVERLARGDTSAVVVDYDVEHAPELLKLIRQNYAGTCVALAMVKGLASIEAAYDMGANFVLIKPVSANAAFRSLGEATALVERMLHRPARLVVPTLAYVSFDGPLDPAIILDLSEGGMAIQALQKVQAEGPLRLQFDLPGSLETMILAAEIVWADSSGRAGLRFIDLSQHDHQRLSDWVRINGERQRRASRLSQATATSRLADDGERARQVELWPGPATVAQRILSTLIDVGIVLLASLVFLAVFLVWVRGLPASHWAWAVGLVVPFVFWAAYLYLFLPHPRGTPGMQMVASGRAPMDKPELFDLVPPSPLVAASSRVLTWLEAHSARASGIHRAATIAIPPAAVASSVAEPAHPEDRLSHS